jgi:hypothetical protein
MAKSPWSYLTSQKEFKKKSMARRTVARRAKPAATPGQNRTRTYIIVAVVILGVVGLSALLYLSIRGPVPLRGLVTAPRPSRGHDNSLELPASELPPSGGTHHDVWLNCGIYDEPITAENAIHSMEHGAVWITYQPDLDGDDVTYLQDLARGERFLILSPYPGLKSPVVLTAWGLQLEVDSVRDGRVQEFIDRYQVGPQTPERGARCDQGVGEPIG